MSKVIELINPLKKYFKVDISAPNTDNNVFRLHYRASVFVVMLCVGLVGWKEFIGEPILCIGDSGNVPSKVLNAYCWIFPTYTLPHRTDQYHRVGKDVAQPGVAPPAPDEEKKYHSYYQWVCLTLFLQALLFRIPHFLWKLREKERMKNMICDLNLPIVTEKCIEERKHLLLDYLHYNFGHQNRYFYDFVFCEILNFVNVVGQIFLMDKFLDGDFINYGTQVLDCAQEYSEECTNPMAKIFPKVTKCEFFNYGPSGGIEKRDAMCVLSINIVNEKVYIFLWFWFMSVALVTGAMMIYRFFVINSVKVRTCLLMTRAPGANHLDIEYISHKGKIGDWFVLYQLSKNINSRIFVEVVSDLAENLRSPTCVDCPPRNVAANTDQEMASVKTRPQTTQEEVCEVVNRQLCYVTC